MKSRGIARKIDSLGRVVIPKEVRNGFELTEGTAVEIFIEGGRVIIQPIRQSCSLCGKGGKKFVYFKNKLICSNCITKIKE